MKYVSKPKSKTKILNLRVSEEYKKLFEKKCLEIKEPPSTVLRSLIAQFLMGDIAA